MLNLKTLLTAAGVSQAALARALGISPAAVAQLVNHNLWPRQPPTAEIRAATCRLLRQQGVAEQAIARAFDHAMVCALETTEPARGHAPAPPGGDAPSSTTSVTPSVEDFMLLRKQTLGTATRKHFNLFRDPFQDDLQSADDMYVSPDIRYVREAMFQTAKHGGLLAVVGESGAGKTTLMRDLEERIEREHASIVIIKPYVLAMEDNDRKGKTLKAGHIAEAILAAVAPLARVKSSPEARFAQLHKALKDSHAAGYRHCLVIDEAHSLPIPTIKHLKRFFELELGFKKLLSIILIGQPELKVKLSERNQEVREVVQRCEMVELAPLEGDRLEAYLAFRLERVGKPLAEVIDAAGIDALRSRLTLSQGRRERPENVSLLYPLAVGNLLAAAMNLAAEIGVPTVTADVVKGV